MTRRKKVYKKKKIRDSRSVQAHRQELTSSLNMGFVSVVRKEKQYK